MMSISPSVLRLAWAVVEEIQNHELLHLTDTALIKLVLQQVTRRILLNSEEARALHDYISTKTLLIRDMAA